MVQCQQHCLLPATCPIATTHATVASDIHWRTVEHFQGCSRRYAIIQLLNLETGQLTGSSLALRVFLSGQARGQICRDIEDQQTSTSEGKFLTIISAYGRHNGICQRLWSMPTHSGKDTLEFFRSRAPAHLVANALDDVALTVGLVWEPEIHPSQFCFNLMGRI
jgi:hypothetical protein